MLCGKSEMIEEHIPLSPNPSRAQATQADAGNLFISHVSRKLFAASFMFFLLLNSRYIALIAAASTREASLQTVADAPKNDRDVSKTT
jgi:hypothetical protein